MRRLLGVSTTSNGLRRTLPRVLGTLGAPARVLDQALAASEGRALPHDTLLPFSVSDARVKPAAAILGARGGGMMTAAKRRAAARNGRLGGRPPAAIHKVARKK